MNYTNASAIVLGGLGGIGKEICLKFIQRGLKNLAIVDIIDEDQVSNSLPNEFKNIKFIYKQCSVADEAKLRECMIHIKEELEWVDIVVNSAGIAEDRNAKKMIDINYGGVVNSTLIGIDLMRKDNGMKGGVIVNVSSICGLNANFASPVYAGTKHAVLGFTRSLKNDRFFEETRVKFITICPGVTNTPLFSDFEKMVNQLLFPTMIGEIQLAIASFASQDVDIVGDCVIAALDDGENGSTWQCENGRIEKLQILEYPKF